MRSLKLLLAYGIETRTAVIATAHNERDLDETCYLLGELGVLRRPPDPIRPSGRVGMNSARPNG